MTVIGRVLPCVAMLLLAGCGANYDCASEDVVDTLREALVDSMQIEAFKARIKDGVEINNIVMIDVDHDVDRYRCKAAFSYTDPAAQSFSKDLEYEVSPVQSGDAAFEIAYDEHEFRAFAYQVTGKEREQAVDERNLQQQRTNRAELMASLRPIPRADAIKQLMDNFQKSGNPPSVVPTQLDPERDDVEDFVVLAPWFGTPQGEAEPRQTHLLFCVQQVSITEGQPMTLQHGAGVPLPTGAIPKRLTVKDDAITVLTVDEQALPFTCSNLSASTGHF